MITNESDKDSSSPPKEHENKSPCTKKEIKYLGITSPVNTNPPTKEDRENTKEMLKVLDGLNILETQEETNKKLLVVGKLNQITKNWILEFLMKKRMPESEAKSVGGHIRTFGSFRLGLNTKGGDIDAVLIVPRHITRTDFFESFALYLKSISEIKDLRCITEAYVPIMKFTFCEVQFDLLFSRINRHIVEDDLQLESPSVLRDAEIRDIRSFLGFRIADDILNLVPSKKNFKLTLHIVRYWAKKNELYSNIIGFLGGISWAILVARICQLYPTAVPSVLVEKFFFLFSNWNWESVPVMLRKINYCPRGLTFPQWLFNGTDQNKLMPIVTPTYPEQNTTHNVTISTRTIILSKMKEAYEIVSNIKEKSATWNDLFVPKNFFQTYKHFLVMYVYSHTANKLIEWQGYVESRIRILVSCLEKNIFIKIAHPYCRSFDPLPQQDLPYTKIWFIGLDISKPDQNSHLHFTVEKEIGAFLNENMRKNYGSYYREKYLEFQHAKRKDLKNYLSVDVIGKAVKKAKKVVSLPPQPTNPPQATVPDMTFLEPINYKKRKTSDTVFTNGTTQHFEDMIDANGELIQNYQSVEEKICKPNGSKSIIHDDNDVVVSNAFNSSDKAEVDEENSKLSPNIQTTIVVGNIQYNQTKLNTSIITNDTSSLSSKEVH